MGGFGGGEVNRCVITTDVSDNPTGIWELSEFSQIEARGLGICAPLWIFRYEISLGKRHSLGPGDFLWVKGTLQEGLSYEMAAVNTPST